MAPKKKRQKRRTKKFKILLLACGCALAGVLTAVLLTLGILLYPGGPALRPLEEGPGNHSIPQGIPSRKADRERQFRLPRIVIIVDDLGYDLDIARRILALDLPLTLSILPYAPETGAVVKEGHKRGSELMLHLPMEPENYPSLSPGPGALLVDMGDEEILHVLASDLAQVPGARGVNNHMGSYFTEKRDKMAVVLGELKRRHLYFIDSRTTTKTVAYTVAKEMGVPTANRNVFLDDILSSRALGLQMRRLMGMARASGRAIGICHPHPKTIEMLKAYAPRLKKEFQMVYASDLVR